jgi:hypothetical protein
VVAHHELVDEMTVGECEWCGNHGSVFVDNSRCEQCESDIVKCLVCNEEQHADDLCRHVFRDSDWEWSGAGAGKPSDTVKQSFFKLLDAMPFEFGAVLRKAIDGGEFHTWIVAPMIGGGGSLYLRGFPDQDSHKFGEALIQTGESDAAEELADGYRWMVSLVDQETGDANRITIAWIDEWTAARAAE